MKMVKMLFSAMPVNWLKSPVTQKNTSTLSA